MAKFFWDFLLFLVPTTLTVDARIVLQCVMYDGGVVRYVGFASQSAVYVDYDVIRSAPIRLNSSGVG